MALRRGDFVEDQAEEASAAAAWMEDRQLLDAEGEGGDAVERFERVVFDQDDDEDEDKPMTWEQRVAAELAKPREEDKDDEEALLEAPKPKKTAEESRRDALQRLKSARVAKTTTPSPPPPPALQPSPHSGPTISTNEGRKRRLKRLSEVEEQHDETPAPATATTPSTMTAATTATTDVIVEEIEISSSQESMKGKRRVALLSSKLRQTRFGCRTPATTAALPEWTEQCVGNSTMIALPSGWRVQVIAPDDTRYSPNNPALRTKLLEANDATDVTPHCSKESFMLAIPLT